jgi:glutathione S-transferase
MNALTAGTMEAGVADANRAQLVSLLDEAELRLANSKFLAGEQYSVADVIFTPVLQQVFRAKKDKEYLETRTNVKRYYEEMRKRPSYKKAFGASESGLATMGIILPSLGKIYFQKITGSY